MAIIALHKHTTRWDSGRCHVVRTAVLSDGVLKELDPVEYDALSGRYDEYFSGTSIGSGRTDFSGYDVNRLHGLIRRERKEAKKAAKRTARIETERYVEVVEVQSGPLDRYTLKHKNVSIIAVKGDGREVPISDFMDAVKFNESLGIEPWNARPRFTVRFPTED